MRTPRSTTASWPEPSATVDQLAEDEEGRVESYTEVPVRLTLDQGQYTFGNHCAACHTIGRGDLLGPDLLGVTARRDHDWLTRFIAAPDKVRAAGDPTALALRAKYQQVLMPRLDLGLDDVDMLIDYIDRQSRAVRDAGGTAANPPAAVPAVAAGTPIANLKSIVDPYLKIQLALNADSLRDSRNNAGRIAAEAGALGPRGAAIDAASQDFQKAGDLKAARTAFARLGDAIMAYAKVAGAGLGDDVKVAYCPMLKKYWLQQGETIRTPYYGQQMSDCGRINATLPE